MFWNTLKTLYNVLWQSQNVPRLSRMFQGALEYTKITPERLRRFRMFQDTLKYSKNTLECSETLECY